ncbi:pyridoxamine 5'-phosphate oxidase family protein [Dictyobacter aurantiacus]|uniref:NimA n=1 Tax=Dictyobacter aurantiacus TaxID=1936993 RepID=A0A401ZJS3_9CHLR|nr:pyridoxamine 5'-phosphate oxidase family protein [Dictyobacter aurantiacus]GCE07103.1 NimA [Dictyobacter aurantiacus]
MPKDYGLERTPANQQRRPQNARDDEWTRNFLLRGQVAYVATHWDEQPFINPTMYWYDAEQHRIFFHSNRKGRVRANSERHQQVCLAVSEFGKLLPSNIALEFSIQYASVIVYGRLQILEDAEERRYALDGLIHKYFPQFSPGREYRPITDTELLRTSVYAIAIESWSGKENWPDQAGQSDEWPPLPEHLRP